MKNKMMRFCGQTQHGTATILGEPKVFTQVNVAEDETELEIEQ